MRNITIDRQRLVVFARVTGFLDAEMVTQITADMRDAARKLGSAMGQHDFLYDLTDTQVGDVATADALYTVLADQRTQHIWARRIAFFTPSALLTLQLQRLCAARPGRIAVFSDRRAATAWLYAERRQLFA
jgi:hypothetical protein